MGKLLLTLLILGAGLTAIARPWIGVNSYYLLAILGPQYIWWWNFQGLRVSLIIALTTILGVAIHMVKDDYYDLSFLLNRQNYWLAFLWFCIASSYFFGSYVDQYTSGSLSPDRLFSINNTIFLFYFVAVLEMNQLDKLRYLVIIFALSTVYLIYWANIQYFTQNWSQFNLGRLMGPVSIDGGAIYHDENTFAMLFVTGLPFIYYWGWELKKKWLRLMLWGIIPLGWHAVFLTGSRGGLVGITVTMVFILLLSNRKKMVVPLLLFFLIFYQWQAGDLMHSRSTQIVNIEGERSASDRITAWKGGLNMIMSNPITGVGLGSFITALPDYIESRHMVAHNTLIEFTAESGIGAGLAYIVIIVMFFKNSSTIRTWCRKNTKRDDAEKINCYNNASTVSFAGLIVCSLFLSLNAYEIFFVLLLINNTLLKISETLREQEFFVAS